MSEISEHSLQDWWDAYVDQKFDGMTPNPVDVTTAINFVNALGRNSEDTSMDSWYEDEWLKWGASVGLNADQVAEVMEAQAAWL